MLMNWNPLWPVTSDERRQQSKEAANILTGNGALWNPASLIEYQAYFWGQIIEANRNFWSMCAAALPGMPAAAVAASAEAAEKVVEPAAATHAVEDLESVLESQTRFWNHLLDANRNLWTGVTFNLPEMPGTEVATAARAAAQRSASSAARHTRSAAKKSAPAKKGHRKH
jgi:hypothetical protein